MTSYSQASSSSQMNTTTTSNVRLPLNTQTNNPVMQSNITNENSSAQVLDKNLVTTPAERCQTG